MRCTLATSAFAFVAVTACGGDGDAERVTAERKPIPLSLERPAERTEVTTKDVLVSGVTAPRATVTSRGSPGVDTTSDSMGRFSLRVDLDPGWNKLVIAASRADYWTELATVAVIRRRTKAEAKTPSRPAKPRAAGPSRSERSLRRYLVENFGGELGLPATSWWRPLKAVDITGDVATLTVAGGNGEDVCGATRLFNRKLVKHVVVEDEQHTILAQC